MLNLLKKHLLNVVVTKRSSQFLLILKDIGKQRHIGKLEKRF